jgi:hypothetical protein
MAKIFEWECDGEIPITMLINTLKYTQILSNTLKCIEIN